MINDAARLESALVRLAALTERYASDFLIGNDISFAQVAKLREKESDAYALANDLRSARASSEAAWSKRDYLGVVRSLEPLEPHLSSVETKRLNYSRSHSRSEVPRSSPGSE
jgi:hypothetical protein